MPLLSRRDMMLATAASSLPISPAGLAPAQAIAPDPDGSGQGPRPGDRVFICNEDSNTLAVIDPVVNRVAGAVNLTSFDEDPRPPFRYVAGGVVPSYGAMVQKPLYRGAISIHGAAPSPDSRLIATTGRGSSNVYLIDTASLRAVGNEPNPLAGPTTNPDRLTSGILVGREPHEPTFTRDGRELWVAVRGENRIAIIDVQQALANGGHGQQQALVRHVETIDGPAQVWFSADGRLAFVISQKRPLLDVLEVWPGEAPRRKMTIELAAHDRFGFTPFQKTSPGASSGSPTSSLIA
jgi:DNA-binding beta-propeller fold protein YncE